MGSILRGTNDRHLALATRSGSHSIVAAWLQQFEPINYAAWQEGGMHPARYLQQQLSDYEMPSGATLAVIVRNPVERFRSMVARHGLSVDDQIAAPMYGALPQLPFTNYFRFEDGLQACAEWLGLTLPIPVLAESDEADKPVLTPEQDAAVRLIYAADIALWESLQP
jgi:hypothetical protein